MKTILLAATVGVLLTPLVADLASIYQSGETRTTTFQLAETSNLVEFSVLMNGEDGGMMGEMQQDKTRSMAGAFTDEILQASDGAVTAFSRTYSDLLEERVLAMTDPMGGDHSRDAVLESDLNDLTVLFNLEEGEFVASFPEDESGDAELLEGLEALLPWGQLISDESVKVESEWSIEPRALWSSFHLGGGLSLVDEDANEDDMLLTRGATDEENIEIDGEITAILVEIEDGIANFTLAIEVTEVKDLTEAMQAMADESENDSMMPDIETVETEREYEGEGTVLWSIEGGYMVSMELSLEFTETQTMAMSMSMGGDDMSIEQVSVFEGETEFTVEVEVSRD